MQTHSYFKAGILSLVLVFAFIVGWEVFLRSQDFKISYNDDESLWAYNRKQVYESNPSRPVVIGSSRIKFDLDITTWESISGQKPIQLALEGTTPRPVLADLANDPNFKGTVILGITEVLFFQPDHSHFEEKAAKRLSHYPHWSLSEQMSFRINKVLESSFVFLQEDVFSLGSLLKRLPIESRAGVFVFPTFPMKWSMTEFNRQTYLTDAFEADSKMQEDVQGVWKKLAMDPKPASGGDTLTRIIQSVKMDIDKIRAKGGQVVFVREPSSGPYLENENKAYPRNLFWERLLKETQTPGIHFSDYPTLANYTCLEWSHLTRKDAISYTQALIPIIEQKTGWKIQK